MSSAGQTPTAPILLLAFNRPDLLEQAIAPLDAVRPQRLFLSLDGPRSDHPDDTKDIQACEAVVRERAALWGTSELVVRRLDQNLGMKRASVTATSWFLDQVECGIILEDDCAVDPSFIEFASELLVKYSSDSRVMAICAQTYLGAPTPQQNDSYRFARTFSTWGMATWKRAWDLLDADLTYVPEQDIRAALTSAPCSNTPFVRFWIRVLRACREGRNPGWSFPWAFSIWRHGGLCVIPSSNLVSNIGYDARATMTFDTNHFLNRVPTTPIKFPLSHPSVVSADCAFDLWSDRNIKGIGWGLEVKVVIKRVLRALRLPIGG